MSDVCGCASENGNNCSLSAYAIPSPALVYEHYNHTNGHEYKYLDFAYEASIFGADIILLSHDWLKSKSTIHRICLQSVSSDVCGC